MSGKSVKKMIKLIDIDLHLNNIGMDGNNNIKIRLRGIGSGYQEGPMKMVFFFCLIYYWQNYNFVIHIYKVLFIQYCTIFKHLKSSFRIHRDIRGCGTLSLKKFEKEQRMKKGLEGGGMKAGGKVSSASKRADGCAVRGKTRA